MHVALFCTSLRFYEIISQFFSLVKILKKLVKNRDGSFSRNVKNHVPTVGIGWNLLCDAGLSSLSQIWNNMSVFIRDWDFEKKLVKFHDGYVRPSPVRHIISTTYLAHSTRKITVFHQSFRFTIMRMCKVGHLMSTTFWIHFHSVFQTVRI